MELLRSRGFDSVVIAGAATAAPRLLSRQTVVAGLSDGAVRVFEKEDARVRMQLPGATSPLPPLFLQSVANLPLRQGPHSKCILQGCRTCTIACGFQKSAGILHMPLIASQSLMRHECLMELGLT